MNIKEKLNNTIRKQVEHKHKLRQKHQKISKDIPKRKKNEREKAMGMHSIRLGSILSFDEDQEKDIIRVMEYLNSTHSTGKFFSNLVRIVFDNPEILIQSKDSIEKGKLMRQLDELGLSQQRDKFFKDITLEILEMKKKVDKIYEMSLKTYMLAQVGKHLALEDKSENNLRAEFILEKQLKELQDTLGITLGTTVFESNKIDATHQKADDILEYIIETYDNILEELKNKFEIQKIEIPIQQVVQNTAQQIPVQQVQVQQVQAQQETTTANNVNTTQESNEVLSNDTSDDEVIDFGDAAMDLLENFFGE